MSTIMKSILTDEQARDPRSAEDAAAAEAAFEPWQ